MEYVLLLAFAAFLLALYLRQQALQQRIRSLEERLNRLADQTGQDVCRSDHISDELTCELKLLKRNGQTVQAVKRLRESTGLDLVQAKQYIDRLS